MIPVFDICRQNEILASELSSIFAKVVEKGIFILGDYVKSFEKAFADYIGVSYAVGVASGTDALTLSLLSLGVDPGDEVILPANSYPSVFGISTAGAIPRLVDIDPATYTIDPDKISKAITKKVKAIVAVHLYGQAADMEKILLISRKYKIPIVEDCAQAVGAQYKVQKVGSIGDIGCFSFYPTKNLGAYGDGGMVVTNNKDLYEKLKLYRMYGEEKRYKSILVGRNSRLDELQAAILSVKLKYLDKWIARRREIAQLYSIYLSRGSCLASPASHLQLPVESSCAKHTYHLYVIRSKRRDELKSYLEKKGIGTGVHYPTPIHLVPSFAFLGYKKGDFPESEKASQEILSLPMFPELTNQEIQTVVKAMTQFYAIA